MAKKFLNPSGFPEHTPEVLQKELRIKDIMRRVYESYGYTPIETPSVEYKETLASKGEISNEVYSISRVLDEGGNKEDDRALRFDLTIPLARYVVQHENELTFPFKRWQIQRVWRGERPQAGRFREFYQADIDVINHDKLPIHFDAEVVSMVLEVLNEIDFGKFTININHRKLLQGILTSFGITDIDAALRAIDKYDKVGRKLTIGSLSELGIPTDQAEALISLLENQIPIEKLEEFISKIPNNNNQQIIEGSEELNEIAALLKDKSEGNGKIVFNPRIARGLDYYTGCVYETMIDGHENYGSICSGGRYADLAAQFSKKSFPGVGISIGLSRLMYILEKENLLKSGKKGVTDVMIALTDEEQRVNANKIADKLRSAGINTQVAHDGNQKLEKQFKNADKIGANYLIIIDETITLKDLQSRTKTTFKDINTLLLSLKSSHNPKKSNK